MKHLLLERVVIESLEKETKVSVLSALGMFLFLSSIPTVSLGGNPVITIFCLFFAILGFRCWIERRTYKRIIEKKSIEGFFASIYLPSLWSYLWRSLLTMICIGIAIEVLAGGNGKGRYGFLMATIIAYWFMGSIFIVDVPFWVRRKVTKLTKDKKIMKKVTDQEIPAGEIAKLKKIKERLDLIKERCNVGNWNNPHREDEDGKKEKFSHSGKSYWKIKELDFPLEDRDEYLMEEDLEKDREKYRKERYGKIFMKDQLKKLQ